MKPYYHDDFVTIYHGSAEDIVPTLGKFDLLLTDPPYGIGEAAGKNISRGKKIGFKGNGSALAYTRQYGNDSWDNEPVPDHILKICIEFSEFQTIFGGNYFGMPKSSCWLVWDKDNGSTDFADCELAWTNFKTAVRKFKWRWNGMMQESMSNKEERWHPTQKPMPLMAWCIEHADRAGKRPMQTILDPFAGSCTTGVAAKMLGRKCVLIEREEKYCEIGAMRLSQSYLPLAVESKPVEKTETLLI
jgi:DNA modification methylase